MYDSFIIAGTNGLVELIRSPTCFGVGVARIDDASSCRSIGLKIDSRFSQIDPE